MTRSALLAATLLAALIGLLLHDGWFGVLWFMLLTCMLVVARELWDVWWRA